MSTAGRAPAGSPLPSSRCITPCCSFTRSPIARSVTCRDSSSHGTCSSACPCWCRHSPTKASTPIIIASVVTARTPIPNTSHSDAVHRCRSRCMWPVRSWRPSSFRCGSAFSRRSDGSFRRWAGSSPTVCSSLVINHRYVRHAHIGVAGRAQEVGAFVVCWTAAFSVVEGRPADVGHLVLRLRQCGSVGHQRGADACRAPLRQRLTTSCR